MVQDQLWTSVYYLCCTVGMPPMLYDCDVYAFFRVAREVFAVKMVGIAQL